MSATEFPAGSRWRHKRFRCTALASRCENGEILYLMRLGTMGFFVDRVSLEHFLRAFERIEHPEAPKLCTICKGEGGCTGTHNRGWDTCPTCKGTGREP